MTPDKLLDRCPILEPLLADVGFLSAHYAAFHPANTGNLSVLLSDEIAECFTEKEDSTDWHSLETISDLSQIRADGRLGYRAEGVAESGYFGLLEKLAGQYILISRTGAQLPSISFCIARGDAGRLFNVIEVDSSGNRIRLAYGNFEYGSIPSIEIHLHLAAHAISITKGRTESAVLHGHPYFLGLLGRHPSISGDFARYNASLYTQQEGINRHNDELVGIIPYEVSGSEALLSATIPKLFDHNLVLWMNHGFIIRESDIRWSYTLMSYAEESARAAIDALEGRSIGLPLRAIEPFLTHHGLLTTYREMVRELGLSVEGLE